MELIWSTRYSVGLDEVDNQHRCILDMINMLHGALPSKHPEEELRQVLIKMVAYTQEHFTFEEQLMARLEFPGLEHQIKEHRRLIDDLRVVLMKLKRGEEVTVRQLLGWLNTWWAEHIEGEDMKYGHWIKDLRKSGQLLDLSDMCPIPAEK